ncbi:hypothetical protein ABEB36_007751 [Hypothenemus hampei]|uniref:Rac GTPase-activating protein 1 n=1 Tax=Hypothenemus hampei TaxID=57062 RepID=A0ABD1EV06_HYPHA
MNTPFKTPLSHATLRHNNGLASGKVTSASEKSDSDESTSSEVSSGCTGSSGDLTIIAIFDDLMRLMRYKRDKRTEDAFEVFAEETKFILEKYTEVLGECQRLQTMLELKAQECSETERRMNTARHILDEEKKKTLRVMRENSELHQQLNQVRDLLCNNRVKIGEEERQKFSFLNKNFANEGNFQSAKNLSCIQEINSTGSMLSDFSVSRSEDDLDISYNKQYRRQRPSTDGNFMDPPLKKRRSTNKVIEISQMDTVRTTTTVTVNKKGPITATSVIESIAPKANSEFTKTDTAVTSDDGIGSTAPSGPLSQMIFESWAKSGSPKKDFRSEQRPHVFQPKSMIIPDICVCCDRRLRFGKSAVKCKDCKSICHTECANLLPLPCVPVGVTPTNKNILGVIGDYAPTTPPMVPALIIHCVNEIELRGLNELGLYRLSASEKDVRSLKEKFLKGRGSPSLAQIDIHVICGCVKDFLRMLNEPLVTFALWREFAKCVEAKDKQDVIPAMYQCIADLPQPNRDTLAYMMLHLQKISESPECKMPVENLAKVFGPTLVGFSSDNPSSDCLLAETKIQITVVEQMIRLPSDYWSGFVYVSSEQPKSGLQQTPSTDSLLRPRGRLYTPTRSAKRHKFHTPPAFKA